MKMSNKTFPKSRRAIVTTGTLDEFFKRSRERATKLDRGERLPEEIRVTFEDPLDLVRALTAERVRVLQCIRTKRSTISSLATTLKRDRRCIIRDVDVLESLGLVRTFRTTNPGHGVVKEVEPLAEKYHLTATV